MAPPLIQLADIVLTFGGTPLLDGVELSLAAGDRMCLVGRNGAGKSTLLRIAAGLVEPDRGMRFVQPGATVRYLPQEPDFSGHATVLSYVEEGLGPGDDRYRARHLLEQLGLTGHAAPARLSGGEGRRAALARVLAPVPDVLLLDEPTNHLDLATIEWLEGELAQNRAAIVMISHDRRFLTTLSRSTVWLDRGRARRIDRGFAAFEAWRDQLLAEEERDRRKLDRKLEAEADWLRYGVTARRKRNVRRLAALETLRQQRRQARGPTGQAVMKAAEAEKSGALVIEAEDVRKAYDGRPIVANFSTRIARGDRIGIVGPNGSGKTTLTNLLSGALPPDAGTVRLGANLVPATLDQKRESLDPAWTVSEALTGGRGDTVTVAGVQKHVIGYMKDFLFAPEQARTPVGALSGGERGRLMLARALAKPSNLLVLDEPTNDLDLETLDVLEELLGDYAGTVILVSHDRDFLDRIVGAVIVAEGGGRWVEYAGGYTDMLAQRGEAFWRERPSRPGAGPGPATTETKPAAPRERPAPKKRLEFHDRHALRTLPVRIAALEAEVRRLAGVIADPTLHACDRAAVEQASRALAAVQVELAAAEERWLELEILREEIEGSA
jgi:ABC transport system ATP-binding/permease protein